ncbi:MAG: hypothetical protein ILNGONEN_00671 [Syntrophorhabdaceae bacterium]|nr:hypothetical protein [Syntrophorhabdaceae bacterium]
MSKVAKSNRCSIIIVAVVRDIPTGCSLTIKRTLETSPKRAGKILLIKKPALSAVNREPKGNLCPG